MAALLGSSLLLGCSSEGLHGGSGEDTFTDHLAGDLEILSPARGAFIDEAGGQEVTIVGTGARGTVDIAGQRVLAGPDGSFQATITAHEGLNLVPVSNEEASLDTSFLFGRFASPDEEVPSAVVLSLRRDGFSGADENLLSLSLLARRALADSDILGALEGKTFTGSVPGGSWKFVVSSAKHGQSDASLLPRAGGASFIASVKDVEVKGKLTIKILISKTDDATITADAAQVKGNIDAQLEESAVKAGTSSVQTTLFGFRYDSNNAGLPCCVDGIVTNYLRPRVQKAVHEKVRDVLSQELAFALNQLSLPDEVSLESAGFDASLEIDTHFDQADFESNSVTLGAAARFHHELASESDAPGWLTVSQAPGELSPEGSVGVSLALDALNQALFVAWAQGGLERDLEELPIVGAVNVAPKLPPVVTIDEEGELLASAGEIVLSAELNGEPLRVALSVRGRVSLALNAWQDALVLVPESQPEISVTWLATDRVDPSMRAIIEAMIDEKLPSLLTPVDMPLPTLPLGAIAPSFGEDVGALSSDTFVSLDGETQRIELIGDLVVREPGALPHLSLLRTLRPKQ